MGRINIVTAKEMKECDQFTTNHYGIPTLVLMERAALATVEEIRKRFPYGGSVLVVAGTGNNGGDGIAAGRLLHLTEGFTTDVVLIGEEDHISKETRLQKSILEKYGCLVQSKIGNREYDIVIDSLFGTGLTRETTGSRKEAIRAINKLNAFVCAVDIPSGIHADTGAVMGNAVRADLTVTFAFYKRGHLFYPGCVYAGDVVVRDIGITEESFLHRKPAAFTLCGEVIPMLPKREAGGNKGTFGKVLVIAGSAAMGGCCELCARGVMRSGAGMVRVMTEEANRSHLLARLPEAMVTSYRESDEEGTVTGSKLREAADWAGCIVIGPGIGKGSIALGLLREVIARTDKPLIIDADGLTMLAASQHLSDSLRQRGEQAQPVILTPHAGEFARLYGCTIEALKAAPMELVRELSGRLSCIVVCKDARTLIAGCRESEMYINSSGNDGMATAGSGDVLAGILGALTAQGLQAFEAAVLGVYIHGLAGDRAAQRYGRYAMMAGDIAEQLSAVLSGESGEKKVYDED